LRAILLPLAQLSGVPAIFLFTGVTPDLAPGVIAPTLDGCAGVGVRIISRFTIPGVIAPTPVSTVKVNNKYFSNKI
jgi:hypothetical protein